jgi:hypothetical protein
MVDFEFRIKKEEILKTLKDANNAAVSEHGEGEYFLMWQKLKSKLAIQDDYLFVDLDDDGWIALDETDFTPDMLVLLIEKNAALATEEVLLALFRVVDMKE